MYVHEIYARVALTVYQWWSSERKEYEAPIQIALYSAVPLCFRWQL